MCRNSGSGILSAVGQRGLKRQEQVGMGIWGLAVSSPNRGSGVSGQSLSRLSFYFILTTLFTSTWIFWRVLWSTMDLNYCGTQ